MTVILTVHECTVKAIKSESPQTFQLTHSVSLLLEMHILIETEKKNTRNKLFFL